jgi:hypothetical protein
LQRRARQNRSLLDLKKKQLADGASIIVTRPTDAAGRRQDSGDFLPLAFVQLGIGRNRYGPSECENLSPAKFVIFRNYTFLSQGARHQFPVWKNWSPARSTMVPIPRMIVANRIAINIATHLLAMRSVVATDAQRHQVLRFMA